MKKFLLILASLLLPLTASAQVFGLNQIASSTQAVPYFGVLMGDGFGNHKATASSSPTVASITATSTTRASSFQQASTTQLTTTGSTYLATLGGNVGIGTTSPTLPLSVTAVSGNSAYFAGNVGIGTNNPGSKLEVNGDIKISSGSGGKLIFADGTTLSTNSVTGSAGLTSWGDINMQTGGQISFQTGNGTATSSKMIVSNAGNVGISQASPNYLLDLGNTLGDKLAVYANGANTIYGFGIATNRLYVKTNNIEMATFNSTGNMGLGTTSPYAQLSISNSATTAANIPLFAIASTTGGTSTSTLMTVLANGFVGIGTSTPTSLLHINGIDPVLTIQNNRQAAVGNTSGILLKGTLSTGADAFMGRIRGVQQSTSANTGDVNILTYNSGSLGEVARFTSGGNVGIGTTTPSMPLDVSSTNANLVHLERSSVDVGQITASNNDLEFGANTNNMRFTVTSGKVYSFASGNVGIGTSTPDGKLNVNGGSAWTTASWIKSLRIDGLGSLEFGGGSASAKYGLGSSAGSFYLFDTTAEDGSSVPNYRLVVNGGNIGIGTTSPAYKLDVNGDFRVGVAGATANSLYVNSTTGNVGIGTTSPAQALTVAGGLGFYGTIPFLSSCGTSPAITKGSTDSAGELTQGTISTGCTITFAVAKTNTPFCTVTDQAGLVFSYVTSASAITVTNIGALSSTKMNYTCIANNN
jgi:hypothetical protein